ncbi:hypothetical protein KAFR_0A00390 [Kazachstania africana CBS 2517]|uniref:Uncharacterized protein n=1 Tax=Kazachstania africana (strain ATCC 22294 / BCRC 22015 / CBS 2517 / CECT 1963 / NBRC 1671 / NRRL Y-8276) TaxID=1071382 RepID=H2AM77_KAZAF|nr:hypothetical protein KAFR_0A00390 [Kazachstania africana CBS 2517]CCF55477.1 hypothetical protein KAFR_0A00390 [Kazachstania africana CBS 2517]
MSFPKKVSLPVLKCPKIITFDAYNTLYCTTLPVMEQYCLVGRKYGIKVDPRTLTSNFPPIFKELRTKYPNYGKHDGITAEQWWGLLIKRVFKPINVPNEMVSDILLRFEGEEAYAVYPDVLEFLQRCKEKMPGIILGIISNTDPIVNKLLKNLKLTQFFEGNIYLSYDLELSKPNREIFDFALTDIVKRNRLAFDGTLDDFKKSCWHIGDELHNDLQGAANSGWNSILIDRSNRNGFFNTTRGLPERSEHDLTLEKVDHEAKRIWELSILQNDIIQYSEKSYVVANMRMLNDIFFT